jgi:hypothetical protein
VPFAGVVTDPNADRLVFWDDSAGQVNFMTLGTGLAFNGTALELDGDLQDISGLTPTDGGVIIGDGTDFVVESGATLRTSIGVAIGVDVQAWNADLGVYAANPLTAAELGELQNIGVTTISATQWGYVGDLDQALATTDSPTFATVTSTSSVIGGVTVSPSGAVIGQSLGFPNSTSTLEPYTPAGGGDTLAAANETITGDWSFNGDVDLSGVSDRKGTLDDLHPNRRKNAVDDFGATGDGQLVYDGTCSGGNNAIVSASGLFVSGDIGKSISVVGAGAGGGTYVGTITSIDSATIARVSPNFTTSGSSLETCWGTDDTTALQAAFDSRTEVFLPEGVYVVTGELSASDDTRIIGTGGFFKRRTGYRYHQARNSVLRYHGAGGSNSAVLRASQTAVGTEGTDFSGDETDDLTNVVFESFHVDGCGLAHYPVYVYRAGNQCSLDKLTAERAAQYNFVILGCFAAKFGLIGSYESEADGFICGEDLFAWSSEYLCFEIELTVLTANNAGSGGRWSGGRGSVLDITSEGNTGRACHIAMPTSGGSSYVNLRYIEANSSGPYIDYRASTTGYVIGCGFLHPGNGGSLDPQDIQIEAKNSSGVVTADEGPAEGEWLILRELVGRSGALSATISSNTYKYRVQSSTEQIAFDDQLPVSPINTASPRVLNGAFRHWQRGTSFTSDGYTADRWELTTSGTTLTLSRQSTTPGDIRGEPEYYAEVDKTSTGDSGWYLSHKMDDIRAFAGKRVVVSFWAKADSALTCRTVFEQVFGSGGSAQTQDVVDVSLTTSWRRYSVEFDVPSIDGKTIGTDPYVRFRFLSQISGAHTFDFALFQIDETSDWRGPSDFYWRDAHEEFMSCCAYFVRLTDATLERCCGVGQHLVTTAAGGALAIFALQYPVPMRSVPTLSLSSVGHFSISGATGSDTACSSAALSDQSRFYSELTAATTSGAWTAGHATNIRATNASATFDLDAEI